jgi:hypothetical protein
VQAAARSAGDDLVGLDRLRLPCEFLLRERSERRRPVAGDFEGEGKQRFGAATEAIGGILFARDAQLRRLRRESAELRGNDERDRPQHFSRE